MRLREVINNLQEEAWTSHKELANILYKHTGNKQLAIDFFHLETEFDSQDDMQSTGLSALDIDPFASDRERVNNILSINNVPVKVLKMKHNDAYETLYSLLQSAPVSESREEMAEAPTYPTDTYFITKADLLTVIDSNYNIDHNKLMQLTDRQKPLIKVIKPIEQPVQMPDISKIAYRLARAGLPKPVKKVVKPGVYNLHQDEDGMIDFMGWKAGQEHDVDLLDKNGREINDKEISPDVDFGSYSWTDYDRQILIHLKDLINYIQ